MKKLIKVRYRLLLCMSLITIVGSTQSPTDNPIDPYKNLFNLLSQEDILEMTITSDLSLMVNDKNFAEYQPAKITMQLNENGPIEYRAKIKPRGKYRRKVCDFPPIKINFDKDDFDGENLNKHENLKLVTHCKSEKGSEELILREYLVYKIYNLITDRSLDVQLVKINWIDSGGGNEIGVKWGFLIESEKELARRHGSKQLDEYAVNQSDLNAHSAAITSLFQYMIGNPDWSIGPIQNLCLIKSKSDQTLYAVPYDFDFSGMVNAPYAVSEYGLSNMKERIYLGKSSKKELKEAKKVLKSKKKEILSVVKSFQFITKDSRKDMLKYIRSFYQNISEPLRDVKYYADRRNKKR